MQTDAKSVSIEMIAQGGRSILPASKQAAIAASAIVGKITTCGQPYLVSGIFIGKYDNPNSVRNPPFLHYNF
jgi:hypothetical protein